MSPEIPGAEGTGKPRLIYLISAYTHDDDDVLEARYQAALTKTAELMEQGYDVFSPIVYSHELGKKLGRSRDGLFWKERDAPFVEACSDAWVLLIDGWDKSGGSAHEIRRFIERGAPVRYIHP
jgi:hypothetical protein